ncbi:N-acetyl-gamma-glutamyl-phosphate reductase [Hanstruepera neustonica]|uniref:N-acetyl-gamma-glutamyl-phosphate reductase n=1 Tax=Hanstruepera neustonica TaxID=1445657 RepID=A0A2K1DYP2_9FLAO|nr:translocation/assembly module TamB domain-containing protein [Hanstruepera neustonica]PNQ73159.1 N-acetyl-gamma-glutamyl-phosphate reductase [Hanstruepera neustonica]
MLFIILVLILSIPAVQTGLGNYATKRINEDFKTNINIDKIGLQFNGDVELKGVLIRDYKLDTLISATEINTSILNFKNLYNGKLVFGDIDLEGLIFNIVTYEGETDTNLDVFVARFDEEEPNTDPSDFLMSSSDVTISKGTFRLIDYNKETPKILEFTDVFTNSTNLVINGPNVSTRINTLAFNDSRGLKMKNLVTNFSYTREQIFLDDLDIRTTNSELKGDVKFLYKREDLKDFTDKVNVEANFTEANIALNELNTFYDEFGINQHATLTGNITGTLNDMHVNNLKLNTSSNSKIYGDIHFLNLFNAEEDNFYMNGQFTNLSSNYQDLTALLPNVLGESIPTAFNKLGNFTIVGRSEITTTNVSADIGINTELGFIHSNLELKTINDIDNASYNGNIIFDDFDVGKFIDNPKWGIASLNLDVKGKGFTLESLNTQLLGDVYSVLYNGYEYNNLELSGDLGNNIYDGKLVSNDPNFQVTFNGLADFSNTVNEFDFVADVTYANLKAMNIVKRDEEAIFKGFVDMKMTGKSLDDAIGSINFTDTYYKNENDEYFFEDFQITSSFIDDKRIIDVNSPDIIEGQLSGVFLFKDIGYLFENALGSMYTNYRPHKVKENQYIDFNFKIFNKIVEVFVPDIELGSNTYFKGRVESDEKEFKLTFKSPRIKLFDYFADQISLQVDSKNPLYNTFIEVDSINTNFYNLSKFNLINVTLNDTLYMRSEFNGGRNNADSYDLSFYHTINEDNKSVVGFKRSDATFKGNKWVINDRRDNNNKIIVSKDLSTIDIDSFRMNHGQEEIKLSGVLRDSTYKDIRLNFKDVDLAKITPTIDSLDLRGNVNGKLDILQEHGQYVPNSTVTIDDLEVNNLVLGSFDANIVGDESLTNYTVDAKIKDDLSESFSAKGNINVASNTSSIDVDLNFKDFNLAPLNPFLSDILTNIRGEVTGVAKVNGSLKLPQINGDLQLNNSGLTVPYLNVDYDFANKSSITLENQSFVFNNINLTDTKYNSVGVLNGSINHVNFSEWSLDIDINTPRLLVLDTKEETEEAPYYGTGYIGGVASIQGPTDQLVISVVGETKPGTIFVIPLSDSESFGDNSFIHFLTPEEKKAKKEGKEVQTKDISGLELDFELDITQDAEIEIVIDKVSGSTIKGRGAGGMLIDINTNGKFNIYGDFIVFEGVYNFMYGGLVQKKFEVEPGGSLVWEGDPFRAQIEINAIYRTQANPSPLLDNPINRSIPVEVRTTLSGPLEKPEIDFNFEFPNVNSTVKSELNYRLDSKEERDNQALFLLATGAFSNRQNVNITGTVTERLNGIINGFFSSSDNKVNIGLNYEAGENTPDYQTDDRLGVTLQTNISDRILVNGKVGVPVGGVSETVVAGDVQIDFLLNEEGTLRAKVFNRENSIRNLGEEIGYTQGIGIAWNVDFDTFGELIDIILKGKKKVEEEKDQEVEDEEKNNEKEIPDYIGFKKKKDK